MRKILHLLFPVVLCLAGGCLSGLPLETLKLDRVQNIRREITEPVDFKLAVAVRPVEGVLSKPRKLKKDQYLVSFKLNGLCQSVVAELKELNLVHDLAEIPCEDGEDRFSLTQKAKNAGADLFLSIEPKKKVVSYLGHNGWWYPNIFLCFFVLVPSWFVPDETYKVELEMEAVLIDLESNLEIMRYPLLTSQELRLNDFQRGWHIWGAFAGPLDEENYESVGEELEPLAMNIAKADMYVKLAEVLPAYKAKKIREAPPPPPESKKTAAIIIGVNKPSALKNKSRYASSDARRFANLLQSRVGRLAKKDIVLLQNESATRTAIQKCIESLKKEYDTVLFYFAGFGASKEGKAFLIPHDGNPADLDKTCLSVSELIGKLNKSGIPERIVLLDATFSGKGNRSSGDRSGIPDLKTFLPSDGSSEGLSVFLAAGPEGEALEDAEFGGGLFTTTVIQGLTGSADTNRNRKITTGELNAYISRKIPAQAMALALGQKPLLAGDNKLEFFGMKQPKGKAVK
jgi:hypothetical protein